MLKAKAKEKQGESRVKVYICTKLSLINPLKKVYEEPAYFESASINLNTGATRYVFIDQAKADKQLWLKGDVWCVYEAEIPRDTLIKAEGVLSIAEDYQFTPSNILNMRFHPLFQEGSTIKNRFEEAAAAPGP